MVRSRLALRLLTLVVVGLVVRLLACSSGACDSAEKECGGRCVDVNRDPRNCGACGIGCPMGTPVCNNGLCQVVSLGPGLSSGGQSSSSSGQSVSCRKGTTNCGGVCVDTAFDPFHCGACGNICPTNSGGQSSCNGGICN
jgi:hypothetical protein